MRFIEYLPMFFACLAFHGNALALEFHGYLCTQDSSAHRAGYEWAERRGIGSRDDCGGKSQSFREGCFAWVDNQADLVSGQDESVDDGALSSDIKFVPVLGEE